MISRLRKAWTQSVRAVSGALTIVATAIDKEDLLTLVGLVLVASGLWYVSRAAALILPGLILLWMFIPTRPPWIERPPASVRRPKL